MAAEALTATTLPQEDDSFGRRCGATKTRNPQSRQLDDSAWDESMDLLAAQSILEPSWDDCQTPHRPLDKTHHKVEPRDVDQADRLPKPWTTNQKMGGRLNLQSTTSMSSQRRPRLHELYNLPDYSERTKGADEHAVAELKMFSSGRTTSHRSWP